jgi:hypothetical protein
MKKIKFINKILTLSLIGGGILTSLPFIMTSCSKAISKISILSISVDEDDTLEGNINHASHQAGHIQVISSDHADHEYLYNIVDADPMLENKIHIVKDIESGN